MQPTRPTCSDTIQPSIVLKRSLSPVEHSMLTSDCISQVKPNNSIISAAAHCTNTRRIRKNRLDSARRALVQECFLQAGQLVAPMFLSEGSGKSTPIPTMPLVNVYSLDVAVDIAKSWYKLGLRTLLLFPVINAHLKDELASEACNPEGIVPKAIRAIKQACPDMCIMSDVALDPFTSHGHDGLIDAHGNLLNDETVSKLCEMALLHAQAGADYIAPSDMMDGRIRAIRQVLDQAGFSYTGLMSYSAKYASAFYGPFRDCLGSSPRFGDKKSYQLPITNRREGILESLQDEVEGADILLVKPASHFLDVIYELRTKTQLPIAAYHVSGEFAMLYAAHQAKVLDMDRALLEHLLSIKRAGADIIITYGAAYLLEKGFIGVN